jgi:hypothetical protein
MIHINPLLAVICSKFMPIFESLVAKQFPFYIFVPIAALIL